MYLFRLLSSGLVWSGLVGWLVSWVSVYVVLVLVFVFMFLRFEV